MTDRDALPDANRPDLFADLEARGLVHQATSEGVRDVLRRERVTAYIGFDPTAASLHVGSLLPVMCLVRLQRAGHRPIAIVGGGTGLIGDPSGKQAERTMLTRERSDENLRGIRAQLERFLDFDGENAALLVNNADWLAELNLLDFLRDVGKHFSVNAMIARDSVRLRLESEQGISFTEFAYSLLQAYDFLALFDRFGCTLQMGGSDQWGNIVSGCDLIRRHRSGALTHGLTFPLVAKADGTKFGKSEAGNIWLDAALTSPYEFYQFWLNADDTDAGRYLRFFTLLELDEIATLEEAVRTEPAKRQAQRVLAEELTRMVHGAEALERARRTTAVLFEGGDLLSLSPAEMDEAFTHSPTTPLARSILGTREATLTVVVAESGLEASRAKARTAIESGAITLNGHRESDPNRVIAETDLLAGRYVVLRRGKKTFHIVRFEESRTTS